jgi:hypothetical protein
MTERHELFDELEAFDNLWHKTYHNLEEAVLDASKQTPYIIDMWAHYVTTEHRDVDGVPDVKRAIEAAQKAEEDSPEFQRAAAILSNPPDDKKWFFDE